MIKVLSWFRRRDGLSVPDFQRYWREEHPKVVLQLPGLRKYVQNHVAASQYNRGRQPFADGVAETWWESKDHLAAHRDSPELAALLADELEFMDPAFRTTITVDELVIVNGAIPVGASKVITWARRRPDLDVAAAQRYWREEHPKVVTKMAGLSRYVQNHARSTHNEPEIIGLPMTWFPSLDQMRLNATSPELAAVRADEPNFLSDDLPFVVVDEHHII